MMDDLSTAVLVLGILLAIVIDALLANFFYEVAREKGFTQSRYFWVSFLFCIIGYLLVASLPDRGNKADARTSVPQKVKPLVVSSSNSVGRWTCPDCGNTVPGDVIRCKCGYER